MLSRALHLNSTQMGLLVGDGGSSAEILGPRAVLESRLEIHKVGVVYKGIGAENIM